MAASPEIRQLAEKLYAQKIVQTMAAAIQMAQSMLETSSKVVKDFNPRYSEPNDEPFTNPHKGDGDPDAEDKGEEDDDKSEEEKALPSNPLKELTLHELMSKEESHELKLIGEQVNIKPIESFVAPKEEVKAEETAPVVPQELPKTAPNPAPKNDGLYQKVDLTAVFGKH